ncbi:quinone oxidoreductase family protein [Actinomadura harenae]|uniref:Oxidoreductase n=1 Tax=Actinomadura harenae TaxID=2483351 RepID=A0A3M2M9Y8_9ACTN|nr:zinc-binding dehydrogenase [Actinomadura harenae]RMI46292.1 oxidoreductase [Actinomadura harenae]
MRHVRYHAHGGPEVLAVEESEVPEPGPGQVLVRPEVIGTNYLDVQLRRETDRASIWYRDLPGTLTGDVVGTVERTGPDVDPALVGTRVAALSVDAWADRVLADAEWLVPVPDDLDAATASLLPLAGAVALGSLRLGRIAAGETVLVTAGAGTIGHLAVQLARHRGAGTVIATAGSDAKRKLLTELGADLVIDHTAPDWDAQVKAAAPEGVHLVLDAIGGDTLHRSLGLLAPFGRAVVYGASAGDLTSVPVTSVFGLCSLTGFAIVPYRLTVPDQARADLDELTGLLVSGKLRGVIGERLPLDEPVRAHRLLEDRAVLGRLVLEP